MLTLAQRVVRYTNDLPSPAALALLRHANVIVGASSDEPEVAIAGWHLPELPERR